MAGGSSARVQTREISDTILVMDRWNGRWALLRANDALALRSVLEHPGWAGPEEHQSSSHSMARSAALRTALRAAGLGAQLVPPPTHLNTLVLKLTKACNYACAYCYDMEHVDTVGHMKPEVAHASVDEAIRLARRPVSDFPDLVIILHGGEPMLRFALIEEIVLRAEKAAKDLDKEIRFCGQTNLSQLNDEIVRFSIEHRVGWGVSLDGPAEFNNKYRVLKNGAGTYAIYERALQQYREFVRSCAVLTTVTKHNQAHLLAIARHFHRLGVPSWDWSLFQPIGVGRHRAAEFQFSRAAVITSWNELFEAVEGGEFDGFPVEPVNDYLQTFITGPHRNMCMRKACGAARDLISVACDGSVDACDCIDRRGPLATLGLIQIKRRDSLERARRTETANLIRSRDVETGRCGQCIWLGVCGGTCLAQAGSLHGVWEDQCALARNAFDRISTSIATSNKLRRYWDSLTAVRRAAAVN